MFLSRISRQTSKLSITLSSIRLFSSSVPSSSKLKEYSFKPPLSLAGGEGPPHQNPNPNRDLAAGSESKQNNKKKQKPLYRPPSSLDRTGLKPLRSDIPFDFRFSYTESSSTVRPIGLREPKYSPFGPDRLDRVWTGVCAPAVDPTVKSVDGDEELELELEEKRRKWREAIQGEPLTAAERKIFVEKCQRNRTKRQINLGRDGLTHNMLNDIHNHWKHAEAVRIKCLGVPTVDMKNVCIQLECLDYLMDGFANTVIYMVEIVCPCGDSKDKTGGKVIHRQGGLVVLYRGRNYSLKKRPVIPLMLWKPHEPIYPRLIKTVIDGLTVEETKEMRKRGLALPPLTKLAKNGYYGSLVPMVRDAFLIDELVCIDCKGLERSDYKKIGCKLRDLVPCVLVTFDKEQIVAWRGKSYCPTGAGEFLNDCEYFDRSRWHSDSECELLSSGS